MKMSENFTTVLAAIAAVKNGVGVVKANAVNLNFNSRYLTRQGLENAIKNSMLANDLHYIQSVAPKAYLAGSDPGMLLLTRVLHIKSGEWIETAMPIVAPKSDALTSQVVGSAVTYAQRRGLMQALSLISDGDLDDDGNSASAETPMAPEMTVRMDDSDPLSV